MTFDGTPRAYYNDIDPFVCDWLEALIEDGQITDGDVDRRSIKDIGPSDLEGYTRVHFFAGIGGWDLALNWAGWPTDRQVWTGSCPCQPFSSAGKGKGTDDERHLWPDFQRLIAECNPATVFGEQVASKSGRAWLSGVFADLEDMGYRRAGADICGASVGAPHIRQRLWWVGNTPSLGQHRECPDSGTQPAEMSREGYQGTSGLGNTDCGGREQNGHGIAVRDQEAVQGWAAGWGGGTGQIVCREPRREVYRRSPLEPSLFPLAHGVPNRVGILRGAGNAIIPQVAAEFVRAFMETENT